MLAVASVVGVAVAVLVPGCIAVCIHEVLCDFQSEVGLATDCGQFSGLAAMEGHTGIATESAAGSAAESAAGSAAESAAGSAAESATGSAAKSAAGSAAGFDSSDTIIEGQVAFKQSRMLCLELTPQSQMEPQHHIFGPVTVGLPLFHWLRWFDQVDQLVLELY